MTSAEPNLTDINVIEEIDKDNANLQSSTNSPKNKRNLWLMVLGSFILFAVIMGVGVAIVLRDAIVYGIKD